MVDTLLEVKKRSVIRQTLRKAIEEGGDRFIRCRDVLLDVAQTHKTRREGGKCSHHPILHTALYLSYKYCLEDSQVVAALLTEVYHCEKTFERVFAGAIFGIGGSYTITGWKTEFRSAEDNKTAMEYFLRHATKSRLTFDGRRLGEVTLKNVGLPPLEASLQIGNVSVASLLVRFGVGVGRCRCEHPPSLLHLCKMRIWYILHSNWELPFGLMKLPLPPALISYMETVDEYPPEKP